MYLIQTSTAARQTQNFSIFNKNVELTLKYNEIGGTWQFDLIDTDTDEIYAQNKGLSVNAPSLINKNLPFVFILIDENDEGVNGVDISELGARLNLYAVSKDDFKAAMIARVNK